MCSIVCIFKNTSWNLKSETNFPFWKYWVMEYCWNSTKKKTIEKIYDTCKISHTCIRLIAPFGRTWLTLRKRCFINTNVTVLFSVCWHAKLAMLPYCFLCAGMPNWQCYRIVFCVLACQTGNVTVLFSVCWHAKLAMLPYCFLCAGMPNWQCYRIVFCVLSCQTGDPWCSAVSWSRSVRRLSGGQSETGTARLPSRADVAQ